MRGSKAKRLRRQAERATKGQPARLLIAHPRRGCAINAPWSTRGVYRALKAACR